MDQAHGMRLEHPIFHGPLSVELDMGDIDTPEGYRGWPGGDGLPAKLRSWKVQTKSYPTIDVGVVSDPYGLEDSPDSEWISSGVNSKGPTSMAIGRQGNLFLWGFFAQPSDMTESARCVFVNSIVYMKGFDGAKPIVTAENGSLTSAREWALVYAGYARLSPEDRERFVKRLFPQRVLTATGFDATKLEAFYRENLELLHPVVSPDEDSNGGRAGQFDVDDECKTLGAGNRSPQFVPKLLERWEKNPNDELCMSLARRYLDVAPNFEATKLRTWYEENKPFLFFSDRAGFRWLVDESAKKKAPASVRK
jgi:hypothetical protein